MIRYSKGKSEFPTIHIIIGIAVLFVTYQILRPRIHSCPKEQSPIVACRSRLKQLHLALEMYENDNPGSYPTPAKWCDLLTTYIGESADKLFHCPVSKKEFFYYAINPNCKPDSPPDTVLLFETKSGVWNLTGGPELMTTENHKEKVCNVLFNDGSVKRIKKDEIANLKWN